MSTNAEIAAEFERMAELSEVLGANRFKVNAFARVARVLAELRTDVAEMTDAELAALDGVGKGAVERIREHLETGRIQEAEDLAAEVPAGVVAVMGVPGVGPKSAARFWKEADVTDVDGLRAALEDGTIEALKGFGAKKVQGLLRSLEFAASAGDRSLAGDAWRVADAFRAALESLDGVRRIEVAGSLRRGRETIGDVDVLVAAAPDDADGIFDAFAAHELVTEVLLRGDTKSSVRTSAGMQVDLRVIAPSSFGAALMYFTGSKEHNVRLRERALDRGMTLNEYALRRKPAQKGGPEGAIVAADSEEAIYGALELDWIPPELREDRGEIALAASGDLPALVELGDVRAELHAHTTASDGRWSIEELARACAARGFHTVAVTDHSRSQAQANGLDATRLKAHVEAIRAAADALADEIAILAGSEVDILADGRLDYDDDVLAMLDVVVASPHAALSQDPAKATDRLVKAIEHPAVNVLGHPTGRLIQKREGLSPDMATICAAAAEHDVALEVNAHQLRLDLRDVHVRTALEHGCKLAIDTDAHRPDHLDMLRFGVMTARRGGATKADVVNCLPKSRLHRWLRAKKG